MFLNTLKNSKSGFGLLNILIAFLIVTIGVGFYFKSLSHNHTQVLKSQDQVIANRYAAELLELFRSMTGTQLNNYLFNNAAKFTAGPVPLCAHVNILDRTTGSIYNLDGLATLPVSNKLNRGNNIIAANRYYQVQIIDRNTLALDNAACGRTTPYNFVANPTKRFFVTVSVTYISRGGTNADVQRAVLTTMLPET